MIRHPPGLAIALDHAARGWHVVPLSPVSKRPLANCPTCRDRQGHPAHAIEGCPCIPAGGWCHGVRAATTDPARLTRWWGRQPDAVPGIAAGPSLLVLIDIDTHGEALPTDLATGLPPGIDLTTEPVPAELWNRPGALRDGRDALRILARARGGPHPWPTDVERPSGLDVHAPGDASPAARLSQVAGRCAVPQVPAARWRGDRDGLEPSGHVPRAVKVAAGVPVGAGAGGGAGGDAVGHPEPLEGSDGHPCPHIPTRAPSPGGHAS
ncbi:bifunctional DNA primase/polymerase [Actinomadura sp. SCN-SB]|uniref:bifunctional DNA primase/polymerase n=1 Tax=Actinomadura sp. SCN-SB TaxID=3373092 RepID=UPI0037514B98